MSFDSEFHSVLEKAASTIDTLYAGRKTNLKLSDLPDEYLDDLRFEVNMISQVLERAVAERRGRTNG